MVRDQGRWEPVRGITRCHLWLEGSNQKFSGSNKLQSSAHSAAHSTALHYYSAFQDLIKMANWSKYRRIWTAAPRKNTGYVCNTLLKWTLTISYNGLVTCFFTALNGTIWCFTQGHCSSLFLIYIYSCFPHNLVTARHTRYSHREHNYCTVLKPKSIIYWYQRNQALMKTVIL